MMHEHRKVVWQYT